MVAAGIHPLPDLHVATQAVEPFVVRLRDLGFEAMILQQDGPKLIEAKLSLAPAPTPHSGPAPRPLIVTVSAEVQLAQLVVIDHRDHKVVTAERDDLRRRLELFTRSSHAGVTSFVLPPNVNVTLNEDGTTASVEVEGDGLVEQLLGRIGELEAELHQVRQPVLPLPAVEEDGLLDGLAVTPSLLEAFTSVVESIELFWDKAEQRPGPSLSRNAILASVRKLRDAIAAAQANAGDDVGGAEGEDAGGRGALAEG